MRRQTRLLSQAEITIIIFIFWNLENLLGTMKRQFSITIEIHIIVAVNVAYAKIEYKTWKVF